MDKHPIENIMRTTMESIRDMIDVNTIVGDAVEGADGTMIIPISRVSFGFVAGGGEYRVGEGDKKADKLTLTEKEDLPFAGGTGAGVTVSPMGFLVVGNGQVRMLSAQYNTPLDRIIEMVPQIICDVKDMCEKEREDEKERDKREAANKATTVVPPAQPTHIVPPEPMSPHMYPDAGHIDDSTGPFTN